MKRTTICLVAAAMAFPIAGCSQWQGGELREVDGYQVRVKTDPDPLEVGETAQVVMLIRDASGKDLDGCQVSFRQYMPGMEMAGDEVFHALLQAGQGRYKGRSGEFGMGGDWALEFHFTCGADKRQFTLERHLEWPE